jgi:hypothetical protein
MALLPSASVKKKEHGVSHGVAEHSIITGLVVAGLILFEWIRQSFESQFEHYPFVFYAGALILIFAAIFFGIHRAATYFEHRVDAALKQQAIPLKRVGVVDGYWLEAVWDENTRQLSQVSLMKIESTGGEGMTLWGSSYDAVDGREVAHFAGTGYLWGDADLIYHYEGVGGIGMSAKGLGYCIFKTDPVNPQNAKFDGAFFNLRQKGHFVFRGRRIRPDEMPQLEDDKRQAFIMGFLADYPKQIA